MRCLCQVSGLADVATSSVSRIESGAISPTADVLDRLWGVLGREAKVVPVVDPAAAVAARNLLGDPSVDGLDAGRWADIFTTLGDVEVPSRLLWRASRFAIGQRPPATGR